MSCTQAQAALQVPSWAGLHAVHRALVSAQYQGATFQVGSALNAVAAATGVWRVCVWHRARLESEVFALHWLVQELYSIHLPDVTVLHKVQQQLVKEPHSTTGSLCEPTTALCERAPQRTQHMLSQHMCMCAALAHKEHTRHARQMKMHITCVYICTSVV